MIERADLDGIAILTMDREPANVIDREFAETVADVLLGVIRDPSARAIVLTAAGSVFSAGVDLFRVLEEDEGYVDGFLGSLDRMLSVAVGSPKPLVAAINGHAIAGGAVLALACDYRVMAAGSSRIGLPELQVGVPFPRPALEIVRRALPVGTLREAVLLGRLYDPGAALERGLVDEVIEAEHLRERALAVATELGAVPGRAFAATKRLLRSEDGETATALDEEVRETWAAPETREQIRAYLDRTFGKSRRSAGHGESG